MPRKSKVMPAYIDGLTHCQGCDFYFRPDRRDQVYCSESCKQAEYRKRRDKGGESMGSEGTDVRRNPDGCEPLLTGLTCSCNFRS